MQDTNSDGKIDQAEFITLVKRYLESLLDKLRSGEVPDPQDDLKDMDPKQRKIEEAKRKK